MQLWLCPLFAFLAGSIPFGLLIAKARGIDIRAHGSGNIGATNVMRVMGWKYGIPCLILDLLKGLLATLLGISLIRFAGAPDTLVLPMFKTLAPVFPAEEQFTAQLLQVVTGLCAILGHNFSPWVGFKGGKGVATSAGVVLALMPAALLLLVVLWALVFAITRYVSVASIAAVLTLPVITLYGSWHHGLLQQGTWNKPLFGLALAIAVMGVWKHRTNIRRLIAGTEHRFRRER